MPQCVNGNVCDISMTVGCHYWIPVFYPSVRVTSGSGGGKVVVMKEVKLTQFSHGAG